MPTAANNFEIATAFARICEEGLLRQLRRRRLIRIMRLAVERGGIIRLRETVMMRIRESRMNRSSWGIILLSMRKSMQVGRRNSLSAVSKADKTCRIERVPTSCLLELVVMEAPQINSKFRNSYGKTALPHQRFNQRWKHRKIVKWEAHLPPKTVKWFKICHLQWFWIPRRIS